MNVVRLVEGSPSVKDPDCEGSSRRSGRNVVVERLRSSSVRMSRQRNRDTRPELTLRRELHARGMRYRVAYAVPGNRRRSIDIAFVRVRLAVFVDGCFWHGCPSHGTWPATNPEWWEKKIKMNRARDADTDRLLREHGWESLRLWEHEVVRGGDRVADAYSRRRRELGG